MLSRPIWWLYNKGYAQKYKGTPKSQSDGASPPLGSNSEFI